MSAPTDHTDQKVEAIPNPTASPNWAVNVSDVRTVKVGNLSKAATENDVKEFFSFSGDIQYIEMQRDTESTQIAYVTFKNSQGADTAVLLTGSNIVNVPVTITLAENYQLPPDASPLSPKETFAGVKKAEDVVSTMLARGFILGNGALNKAKSFDERHQLTSNASAKVASLDRRMGLSNKLSMGTAMVNEKMREMDVKYQVSEKTRSAYAAAEQKANSAGSAIMRNPYVSSGALWVSSAFTAVAKAAEDVNTMTKEKVEMAGGEKKETTYNEKKEAVDELEKTKSEKPSSAGPPEVHARSGDDSKSGVMT